jgi:hypothetical protein
MSSSQSESSSNGGLSQYMQMLVSFGTIPKWHNFLSILFIWLITAGFIIIPSSLISYSSEDPSTTDGPSQQVLSLTFDASLYVRFYFTAFRPPSIL